MFTILRMLERKIPPYPVMTAWRVMSSQKVGGKQNLLVKASANIEYRRLGSPSGSLERGQTEISKNGVSRRVEKNCI